MSEFAVLATLNFPTEWQDVLSISDTYSESANSFDFAVVLPQGTNGAEGDTVTMTVTFKPTSAVSFANALSLSDLKLNFEKVKSYTQEDAIVVDISTIAGAEAGTYTYNQYEYDDKFYICELSFFNSINMVSSDDVEKYVGIYPKDASVSGDLTYPSIAICLTTASDTQSKIYRTAPFANFEALMNAQGPTEGFSNITSVKISNGINKIFVSAFMGFSSMTDITIPSSVTSIGDNAFASCDSLENISIGCDFGEIFKSKTSIKNVTLLEGVTSIESNAFNGRSNLVNISIPNTVTSIGENAFKGCSSLTSITFTGTKLEWNSIVANAVYWNYNTGDYTIHCTDGDIAK